MRWASSSGEGDRERVSQPNCMQAIHPLWAGEARQLFLVAQSDGAQAASPRAEASREGGGIVSLLVAGQPGARRADGGEDAERTIARSLLQQYRHVEIEGGAHDHGDRAGPLAHAVMQEASGDGLQIVGVERQRAGRDVDQLGVALGAVADGAGKIRVDVGTRHRAFAADDAELRVWEDGPTERHYAQSSRADGQCKTMLQNRQLRLHLQRRMKGNSCCKYTEHVTGVRCPAFLHPTGSRTAAAR